MFPAPPINREFSVTVESPVPPLVPASVPVQEGVKVWMSPEEVIVSLMFVSDEVANVCVEPV